MNFLIKTLGCKVNQSESEQIASQLIDCGFSQVFLENEAEIIVINTCTVTSVADAKARQLVGRAIKNSTARIFVTGCGVNNEKSGFEKFKNVTFVKQEEKHTIAKQFYSQANGGQPKQRRSRALLKIQDGCDHHCSYCIVPHVRGPSRSIDAKTIIRQADKLIQDGFKEIVLTGVDIGAFNDNGLKLTGIVKQILAIESTFRIRLSSLEPQSITETFIEFFLSEERVCNHIHLPLQSGSDDVLRAMNRPYKAKDIISLVKKLKNKQDLALTCDVIVGFPGEGEDDFKKTQEVVQEVGFSKIHIFRYSERPPMPATFIKPKVPESIKKQRAQQLRIVAEQLQNDFRCKLVGKRSHVLVERKQDDHINALTSNYCPVKVEGNVKKGALVEVKIDRFQEGMLFAKLV